MKDDDYFLSFIKKSPEINEKTKNTYLRYIDNVQKNIWPKCHSKYKCDNDKCCLAYILKHPKAFTDKLNDYCDNTKGRQEKNLGNHTRDIYMSSMMALFLRNQNLREKHYELYQKWKEMHDMIRKPIDIKYKSNEPTSRQKEGYMTYDEIIKIAQSLPKGSQERLLLMMYTEIPPVRSDYVQTRIFTRESQSDKCSGNYIILTKKNPRLILNKYKTAKTYKTLTIDIPPTLYKEIKNSLEEKSRDYLFVSSRTGEPFEEANTFNKWANRTLKKITNKPKFSISMLRHIFITRRDLKLEEKSGLEQEKIAKLMGHSIEQQRRYLWHSWIKKEESGIHQQT